MSSQVTFKLRYSLSQEWSTEGSNVGEGGRGNKVIAQQGKDRATGLTSGSAQSKVTKAQCEPKLPTAETTHGRDPGTRQGLPDSCTHFGSQLRQTTDLPSSVEQGSPCNFPLSQEVK